jgi:hypothetical protein
MKCPRCRVDTNQTNILFMKKKNAYLIPCLGLINAPLEGQTIQHVDAWPYENGQDASTGVIYGARQ